ncbi:MAG: hypothetical protein K6357_06000 [Elusimicrobiota bacterium]
MLEKAILINPFDNLNIKYLKKFDRVYTGSNFCANLIPDFKHIKFLYENGIKNLTIATSLMNDNNVKKAILLLNKLTKSKIQVEVSATDIGFINEIRRREFMVEVLLSRPISHDYLRMDINFLSNFIKKYRIKYVETDEEFIVKKLKDSKIPLSYYYPFEYLAMTRFCPYEYKIGNCKYSCIDKNVIKLEEEKSGEIIYLKENSYFRINKIINSPHIKRLVLNYGKT